MPALRNFSEGGYTLTFIIKRYILEIRKNHCTSTTQYLKGGTMECTEALALLHQNGKLIMRRLVLKKQQDNQDQTALDHIQDCRYRQCHLLNNRLAHEEDFLKGAYKSGILVGDEDGLAFAI